MSPWSRRSLLLGLLGVGTTSLSIRTAIAGGFSRKPSWSPNVIRAVQARLEELHFSPGPLDGIYGPLTSAAIADFQMQSGLNVDGKISEALLEALDIN